MNIKTVPFKTRNKDSYARIEYSESPPWKIVVSTDNETFCAESQNDLFDALIEIREALAEKGEVLMCNGARKDVFPSPASRSMAGGQLAYRIEPGMPATRKNLVNIFDSAPFELIASPGLQRSYYYEWLESLKQEE